MTKASFERWLRQGRGNAALFIQTKRAADYRDALLDACTHNLCYDRQCEETRGYYLANLVGMTGRPKYFRDGVLDALRSETNEFGPDDVVQMFGLARHWAEGRQVLYDVFARRGFRSAGIGCAQYLVKMDGLDALLFTLRYFGRIAKSERAWQFQSLVSELEEREGDERAAGMLAEAASGQRRLARLMKFVREAEEPEVKKAGPRASYESARRKVRGQRSRVTSLVAWARKATVKELRLAADDFRKEKEEGRLLQYMRIFWQRDFHGSYARLIELTKRGNWRLSHAAANILTKIDAPELRAIGLKLLENEDRCDLGLTLLKGRGAPGDYQLIEGALRRKMDDGLHHSFGNDVLNYLKSNRTIQAVPCLLLVYEDGPCSMCRRFVVEALIRLKALPEYIREECRYDADSETRELVGNVERFGIPRDSTRPIGI